MLLYDACGDCEYWGVAFEWLLWLRFIGEGSKIFNKQIKQINNQQFLILIYTVYMPVWGEGP